MAPEFSRSHLQGLIEQGHVRVDGAPGRRGLAAPARRPQSVQIDLVPTEESQAFQPQAMALQVIYEDEHLLVLDKPAGLVVHPAPGNWQGTLLNGLLARDPAAAALPRAGIVHRLDKDTSGVMMVGRSLPAVTALVRDIAARDVHRHYLALAQGAIEPDDFDIDAPIGRDPQVRVRMAVVAGGRPSRAPACTVCRQPWLASARCIAPCTRGARTRSACTWRTVGHPLVADALYGGGPHWVCSVRPCTPTSPAAAAPHHGPAPGVRVPASCGFRRGLGPGGAWGLIDN